MKCHIKHVGKSRQFLAFYQFQNDSNPKNIKYKLLEKKFSRNLLGTIILANEGINGSITGCLKDNRQLLDTLEKCGFNNLKINEYPTVHEAFDRFTIKIKNEIVTSKFNVPKNKKGYYIDPEQWDEKVSKFGMTVLDVRNFYESKIGSFLNAVKPKTRNFKEFKNFIIQRFADHPKDKPIAMFCTGGIRCEKAANFMISQGFSSVYQLNGGILSYFKKHKKINSLWNGDCFVFDKRLAINKDFERMNYQQCYSCKNMINLRRGLEPMNEWALCDTCKNSGVPND